MTKTFNNYSQSEYSEVISALEPMIETRNRYIEAVRELDSIYTDLNIFIDSIIEQLPSPLSRIKSKCDKMNYLDKMRDAKTSLVQVDRDWEFYSNN